MKGIMFDYNMGMHHAALLEWKTVTRRIGSLAAINKNPSQWEFIGYRQEKLEPAAPPFIVNAQAIFKKKASKGTLTVLPFYALPGSTLYIKEPVIDLWDERMITSAGGTILYRYPTVHKNKRPGYSEESLYKGLVNSFLKKGNRWKNKMFMKAEHARHYIHISNVTVERLHDITDEDCIAEGIITRDRYESFPDQFCTGQTIYDQLHRIKASYFDVDHPLQDYINYDTKATISNPRKSYFSLLAKIHGKELVEKNPWVFRYEFKKLPTR